MTLPKPIYESLPALYVVAGITATAAVDSFMSFISGILMGGCGIAIMCLRRNYRLLQKELDKAKI